MKALTICQPYAELIARGEKRIENRTWPTHYRGPIAIHAGKSRDWLDTWDDEIDGLAFGAVVAVADLVGCKRIEELTGVWKAHEHAEGPWCWMLSNVRRLPDPIPCGGQWGLWDFETNPPNNQTEA